MDENTTNEIRIWGPPGCGKTTLGRQIERAAKTYGSDNVLVTSFTKAAATELAGRNLPVTKGLVGTLHSHCYRALGCPSIAEAHVEEFNKDFPQYRLTATGNNVDEYEPEFTFYTFGDELYAKAQILRAKMIPEEQWPIPARRFSAVWTAWKHAHGVLDFTDLIEESLSLYKVAPSNPKVIVVDEAQDLTRLQLTLVRQWGRYADHILLAADDDQTIFTFAGAAPEVLLDKSGEEYFRHVLSQSYRVPRAVHALSQAWIQKVARREHKEYKPRDYEGCVRLLHKANYKQVRAALDEAERHVAAGKTVMFLASCSYMIEPLRRALRDRGLPFHNPYRRKRLDWNPLGPVARGASPVDRLLAYLVPRDEASGQPWTGQDIQRWTAWLRANVGLTENAADLIKKLAPASMVPLGTLKSLLEPEAYRCWMLALTAEPLEPYIRWWLERIAVKRRKLADYPAKVAVKHGAGALKTQPSIIIGTGHSVKGDEADVVYIFPDLSASGMRQWEGRREERDTIIRLGYVMMTRCREELIICDAAGPHHMPMREAAARCTRA